MIDVELLKQLREETQASIADCRIALEEAQGDYKKAIEFLKKRGAEIAEKKKERETSQGLVDSYVHAGKIGVVLTLLCETDFVARTAEFKNLSHEIAMHIAAMNPKDVDILLKQEYVRDPKMTVQDLIKQSIGKLGENIVVREFNRVEL